MIRRRMEIRRLMITDPTMSQNAIGRALGISGPAVSMAIGRDPELRRLRTQHTQGEQDRLRAYRSELAQTLTQVRRLAIDINRSIKALDEELESVRVDEILGLRAVRERSD